MSIRCLIVDDKPLAIDILSDYVGKISFLELKATTTNPIEGLRMIGEQKIDLVFLDIQMPELNGLNFIKLAGNQCKVILTTAYSEHALDGYEHDVIDYLLKPISFERFYKAAGKARQFLEGNLGTIAGEPKSQAYLFVKTEHRIQKIDLDDILFIEGLQNYIDINIKNSHVLSLQPLKKIEEQLPANDFVRVHRSFIVALKHINSIERSRISIGDKLIPIGDSYRDGFFKLIGGE
jgi:two-component system LytT family response regulator